MVGLMVIYFLDINFVCYYYLLLFMSLLCISLLIIFFIFGLFIFVVIFSMFMGRRFEKYFVFLRFGFIDKTSFRFFDFFSIILYSFFIL